MPFSSVCVAGCNYAGADGPGGTAATGQSGRPNLPADNKKPLHSCVATLLAATPSLPPLSLSWGEGVLRSALPSPTSKVLRESVVVDVVDVVVRAAVVTC